MSPGLSCALILLRSVNWPRSGFSTGFAGTDISFSELQRMAGTSILYIPFLCNFRLLRDNGPHVFSIGYPGLHAAGSGIMPVADEKARR